MGQNASFWKTIPRKLSTIYSKKDVNNFVKQAKKLVKGFRENVKDPLIAQPVELSGKDIALITYANTIESRNTDETPLDVLGKFIDRYRINKFKNAVHILPFYPWDTDRGFSVMDYYSVKEEYGEWEHVAKLGQKIDLMFDFVANHVSIDNPLVQNALIERHLPKKDNRYARYKPYKNYVIAYGDQNKPRKSDLQKLARPRPNPVLTRYSVHEYEGKLCAILGELRGIGASDVLGHGWVWTTFSRPVNPDGTEATKQVDLNFANYKVLLEALKVLLFYVEHGAKLIRLDAIGYIWKKIGATSLHEPECHMILNVLYDILKSAAPGVVTIAEVNEPQDMVLTYLGTEKDPEADIVYQFTHFPLTVHALLTGKTKYYKKWIGTLQAFKGRQFITVLGSHDGMGLKPVRQLLPENEIDSLVNILVGEHKALPNYASLPGGHKLVYEVCATPWNLVNPPGTKDHISLQIDRYLLIVAMGLLLRGMPAIYFNGLIGSDNYELGGKLYENRTINREIFDSDALFTELDDIESKERIVMERILRLLKVRSKMRVFDPTGTATESVEVQNEALIALKIQPADKSQTLLGLFNLSPSAQKAMIPSQFKKMKFVDALNQGIKVKLTKLSLEPYAFRWLITES